MSQHLSEEYLKRYRNGELLPGEILSLDAHLANCVSCQAEGRKNRETQNATEEMMRDLQVEPDFEDSHLLYQELADYVDNTLSDVEREIADAHLEYCQNCKAEVEDLFATKARLALLSDPDYSRRGTRDLWQRLAALWQLPSVRIPAQAAAVIVLVALIAWAMILYSRKTAEEARIQSDQKDKVLNGNLPPPSTESMATNKSTQEQVNTARPVVDLIDAGHSVTLNSDGKLSGLESASAQAQNEVISALKSGRVASPSFMAELKGRSGRLMGFGSSEYGLLNPVARAVESSTPIFRWRAVEGAESYVVAIYGSDAKKIVASGALTETKWKVSAPLDRGRIYTWQVRATKKGEELLMPPPAAPEAKFRIIDAAKADELAQIRRSDARSHLMLGLAYANAGLLEESARELRILVSANPKSSVARSLLRSVEVQKRSK
jgi:anti-sigma factor RsiW